MKKIIVFAALLMFVVSGVSFAQARENNDRGNSQRGGDSGAEQLDSTARHDQQKYKDDNFEGKFGVRFRPHMNVCDVAAPGDFSCSARVVVEANRTPAAAALPAGYGPVQFRTAYNLTGIASTKKIVAVVDAYDDPNIANDLNVYSSTFGLPKLPTCSGAIASSAVPCFQKVNQRGSTTSRPTINSGWALEIALDVETAHAVCQNCSILLVEADSASYTNLMAAVDRAVALGANVVSNSYGSAEFSGESAFDSHFNHPGVAFTFSSGDSGYGVGYPAASPYVTAVGGTSLFLNSDNSYNQEVAWSGAGSGCSVYEPKPSFQIDTQCANRTVADVSAVADPNTGAAVYSSVRYGGVSGWFKVGGTSLATPLIAATYALGATIPSTVQANSMPYSNTASLHDVLTGSNGVCGTYLCAAGVGFDGPTGLGSPKGVLAF